MRNLFPLLICNQQLCMCYSLASSLDPEIGPSRTLLAFLSLKTVVTIAQWRLLHFSHVFRSMFEMPFLRVFMSIGYFKYLLPFKSFLLPFYWHFVSVIVPHWWCYRQEACCCSGHCTSSLQILWCMLRLGLKMAFFVWLHMNICFKILSWERWEAN